MFQKLTLKNTVYMIIILFMGITYILTDQIYLSQNQRVIAFFIVIPLLFIILFALMKPKNPFHLSNTLFLLLGVILIPLYIISDLIIKRDYSLKPLIISFIALIFPYLIAMFFWIFKNLNKTKYQNQ
jgi:hypothetical protein